MKKRLVDLCHMVIVTVELSNKNIISVFFSMLLTRIIVGAGFCEYKDYRMWEIGLKERSTYFVKRDQLKLLKKYNSEGVKLYHSKWDIEPYIKDDFGREIIDAKGITYEKFQEFIQNKSSIMYKPVGSSSGKGIKKYYISSNQVDLKKIYDDIALQGEGIIEEVVKQHKEMDKLFPYCVNTIRVVSINDNGKCSILYATLRMGTDREVAVDNLHGGGIAAVIDIENGKLITGAVDENGNYYEEHPYTKQKLKGFQIPNWQSVIDLIQKLYNAIPGIGYIGWDVAVGTQKPIIIEANILYPGYELLQAPYAIEKRGCKYVIEPYL